MAVTPDTIPPIGTAPSWPALAGVTDKNAYLAQVEAADTRQQPYTDEQNAAINAINAVAGQTEANAEIAETKAGEAEVSASESGGFRNETLYFRDESEQFKDQAEAAVASLPEGTIDDLLVATDKAWSSQKISDELESKTTFDYVESFPPSVDTNPAKDNPLWLDTSTGEIFVCVDSTTDVNVWAGQYGTVIAYFDDGSAIDGLTYAAMVSAGKYDATTDTGYFGEVSSATLMTGDALASDIGLTAGTSQHSSEGWLKFYVGASADCNYYKRLGLMPKPYVIYAAKKPYRHTVSWDDIYARGAVYGSNDTGVTPTGTPTLQDASVTKSGKTLSVRLMTGVDTDPMDFYSKGCAANVAGRSEWNQLFYRIHTDIPTCPAADNQDGGPQVGANWANFTNSDVIVGSGDGRYTWTQETYSSSPPYRATRGGPRVSNLNYSTSSNASSSRGWRPVLVLVS